MTHEDKLVPRIRNFRTNSAEDEFLAKMAEKDQTNDSNVLRRAIRSYAKELGLEVPQEVFADKPGGNWVKGPRPKKENRPLIKPSYLVGSV